MVRLSQRPALLISGSGSWPQREGLSSPAARHIYRRNFPPVGFIQSRTVLLVRRQSRHMKRDLNCFDQNLRNGPDNNDSNNGNEHVGMQKRC